MNYIINNAVENKLNLAQEIAKQIHENHKRVSGETYYNHAAKVASNLRKIGVNDETILILGYLHHAFDYSLEHKEKLLRNFGQDIVDLIEKYKKIRFSEIREISPKDINQKFIIQTFINLTKDMRLLILRLADKAANIVTAYALTKEYRIKGAERSLYLYAPICHLLGISTFAKILQNEAFKILYTRDYLRVKRYTENKVPQIHKFFNETETFLNAILKENGINSKIESRIKSYYSIYRKSLNKNKGIDQFHDLVGLRILVNTVEECYKAEDILNQLWEAIPGERDDYIQNIRPSGYRSIHNTYRVTSEFNLEVQIKTFEMHEENEHGLASHALYKIGEDFRKRIKDHPEILKELSYQQAHHNIPLKQFEQYVYVFTPKGDIIELPKGSNLIDFAYALHEDMGNSCVGGLINDQMQKLDRELKDGDRVQIKILSSKKMPSPDWLKFVKTQKARSEIRRALNTKK